MPPLGSKNASSSDQLDDRRRLREMATGLEEWDSRRLTDHGVIPLLKCGGRRSRAGARHATTSIGMRVFEALVRSERSEQQFLGLSFLQGAAPERFHAKLKKILEAAGMDVRQLIHDKGKAEGKADAILKVLASRNLSPPERQRRRIQEERDLELLDRWLENALTATVHGDVFR